MKMIERRIKWPGSGPAKTITFDRGKEKRGDTSIFFSSPFAVGEGDRREHKLLDPGYD